VWRWLNVEVDSMAGGPDQPGPDDVRFDDVPDPDLEALARAMAGKQGDPTLGYPGAFVSVRPAQPASWNEAALPFKYCFVDVADRVVSVEAHVESLNVEGLASLWFANATGAYEVGYYKAGGNDGDSPPCDDDADLDPDVERIGRLGDTADVQGRETSVVYMETARDYAASNALMFNEVVSFVTAHEIGHQFELPHRPNDAALNLMDPSDIKLGQVAWRWKEDDIKTIRTTDSP